MSAGIATRSSKHRGRLDVADAGFRSGPSGTAAGSQDAAGASSASAVLRRGARIIERTSGS